MDCETPQPAIGKLIKRGLYNRCPHCGMGKLLHKYTVPHKSCSHCHLDYDPLRADDGPAWATILIAGHFASPIMFWVLSLGLDNLFLEISVCIAIVLGFSALILPRAKGIFMNLIWMSKQSKD